LQHILTDVGGAYRWDATNNKWVQLLDWLNESEIGFKAGLYHVRINSKAGSFTEKLIVK